MSETEEPQPGLRPGDQGPADTPGAAENVCPRCSGSGQTPEGGDCPVCAGTGRITEVIGGE